MSREVDTLLFEQMDRQDTLQEMLYVDTELVDLAVNAAQDRAYASVFMDADEEELDLEEDGDLIDAIEQAEEDLLNMEEDEDE